MLLFRDDSIVETKYIPVCIQLVFSYKAEREGFEPPERLAFSKLFDRWCNIRAMRPLHVYVYNNTS